MAKKRKPRSDLALFTDTPTPAGGIGDVAGRIRDKDVMSLGMSGQRPSEPAEEEKPVEATPKQQEIAQKTVGSILGDVQAGKDPSRKSVSDHAISAGVSDTELDKSGRQQTNAVALALASAAGLAIGGAIGGGEGAGLVANRIAGMTDKMAQNEKEKEQLRLKAIANEKKEATQERRFGIQEKRAEQDLSFKQEGVRATRESNRLKGDELRFDKATKRERDIEERTIPGLGVALTKSGAKELRGEHADIMGANGSIDRLLEIANTPGKSLSLDLRTEAETLVGLLMGQLRKPIVGPGAVSDAERAMLKAVIADPTALFSLDRQNVKALQTLRKTMNNILKEKAKTHGIIVPEQEKKTKDDFLNATAEERNAEFLRLKGKA